ncbi:acidic fibroblast growth factor intracellular-binding protein isoform X1 [Cloeon dipterum]|uniref:acidic fibroblast growth factor intracellular-binding protein isoform X1 n=1 Tax=Cloeon dipterum TaxID=197152 RepID=UPI00321FCF15
MDFSTTMEIFVSNYTLIDNEIYELWVEGVSAIEAVCQLKGKALLQQGSNVEMLQSEIEDHYRTYSLLERLLHNPAKIKDHQLEFQIEPQIMSMLIQRYYKFDDAVYRDILGKKLSTRNRKDLDDLSERTGINILSCRRQFDNAKRVFKVVEEMPGLVVKNIIDNFALDKELAKSYATVVFLGSLRFDCTKRKLQYLSFQDLSHCAHAIMANWTCKEQGPEQDDTEFDREFLLDLKDLRVMLDKDREHKHFSLVCTKVKPQMLEKVFQDVENNFKTYTRAILGISCGLHRSREMRTLFIDMVEKCLEPWYAAHWSRADLSIFLEAYTYSALEMDALREAELRQSWERCMKVLSTSLICLHKDKKEKK